MLTEQEITKNWRNLFKGNGISEETLAKAGELITELRPESPLRHRLTTELTELRKLCTQQS